MSAISPATASILILKSDLLSGIFNAMGKRHLSLNLYLKVYTMGLAIVADPYIGGQFDKAFDALNGVVKRDLRLKSSGFPE